MAEIIIRKRVSLDFLGDRYVESYLEFKSIAVRAFPKIIESLKKAEGGDDNAKLEAMLKVLEDHFVEGIFDKQKVNKEDVGQFDNSTIVRCFEALTGQDLSEVASDPKGDSKSKTTSSTEAEAVQT